MNIVIKNLYHLDYCTAQGSNISAANAEGCSVGFAALILLRRIAKRLCRCIFFVCQSENCL
jgi:hypothetical protein